MLPAIAQRVGPASMNDANARDRNPLTEESSWATEEDVHWLSKNRSLAIKEWKLLAIAKWSLWLSKNRDFGYRRMGVFGYRGWSLRLSKDGSLWLSRNGRESLRPVGDLEPVGDLSVRADLNFPDPIHGASSCSDRCESVCSQTQTGDDAGNLSFYTLAEMGGTDRRRRLT